MFTPIGRKGAGKVSLESISGKSIAVVDDYITESTMTDNTDTMQYSLIRVKNIPEGLRRVSTGEIDFFLDNLAMGSWYLGKEAITNLTVSGETPFSFDLSVSVSKKMPVFFQLFLRQMTSSPKRNTVPFNGHGLF